MGLLDSLFSGGGSGGGLLDFLNQQSTPSFQDRWGVMPYHDPRASVDMQYLGKKSELENPALGANQPSPLDNAQWPSGPVGAPANFADRFNAMPGAPQPFQGAGRSFDSATFDPSTYAPNQAQPISVGNYQMPRMGTADQFTAPMNAQAQLPPNAQPTQGQLPPQAMQQPMQQPMPPQQTPPTFLNNEGGLGAGLRGFVNNLHTGPLGAIIGGLGSAAGMQGPAQQNLKAQFESLRSTLIQNGETPQAAASKAMVAVMNPEAAKTILPELFTSKEKYGVISEDPLEGKKYGFINERDQTVNGRPINQQPASTGGGLAGIQAAQNAGVTGDALYEHLPPAMRNTVKAMIEGRQPLPSTTAMRSPATLALIDAAHTIDPAFDATVWKSRNEAGPDWSKGKSSEMVRSANQTLAHVGSLMNAMDALKNRGMPAWNAVANTVSEQFGTGEQGSFRTNAHAVAEEMSKVFKGANLSDSEIRHWEQNLSENMSPTQQRAQVAKLSELLHGSLQALEEKRLAAMGPAAAAKAGPLIKEEGQQVLQRIDKWVKNNAAPGQSESSSKPATVVQNGHTYTLQSDGSYK